MPSLLPPLSSEDIVRLRSNLASGQAVLIFRFEEGCAPAGLFSAVVVHLSQKSIGWKPFNKDVIEQQYSNAIKFVVMDMGMIISLVDSYSHFEVHCNYVSGTKRLPKITNTLTRAMQEVIDSRNFNISCPQMAFYCRCRHVPSHPHVATVGEYRQLSCVKTVETYDMISQESCWLASEDSKPDLVRLINILTPAAHDWHLIGTNLYVPDYKLASISRRYDDDVMKLNQILCVWRDAENRDAPFSLQTIIDVFRSPSVNNAAIAKKIEHLLFL